ncbi:MAG: ribonuclease P protein component [Crocinitomicaceae bacterium]|jgi:ribonuclease P protein component
MDQSFGKEYKLCSRILIDKLFQEGKRLRFDPFSLVYLTGNHEFKTPFQVLISVPKKQFKRAHDRNYVKRRIREILRKNKSFLDLQQADNNKILLAVVYNFNQQLTFAEMEQKLVTALEKLSTKLKQ